MPANKSNESKVAYIYKENYDQQGNPTGNGVWYPIIGIASTNANYDWAGTHTFEANPVTFEEVVKAKAGVNSFPSATERDAALPTPAHGTVAFVKTVGGEIVNQIQYYSENADAWVDYSDTRYFTVSTNTTVAAYHAGKTITVTGAATITLPSNASVPLASGTRIDFIRMGSGEVTFAAENGVTLYSKYYSTTPWLKINAQYSAASVLKVGTNTWVLVGDLKS